MQSWLGGVVSRIFLSHSSANNAEAIAIRDWLIAAGWDDLFVDLDPERGIKAGERWQAALKRAAERCELVIFLVSPAWAASKWCLAEFLLAKNLNKRIFGVIVEPTPFAELPIELTAEWQLVDLVAGAREHRVTVRLPPGNKTAPVALANDGLARLRIGLMEAGLDPRYFAWPPESDPDRAPYRGLKSLEAEDAGIFFGRDAPIIAGLDLLRGLREAAPPRLVVILGASGAGKSSFMRAGLRPRLSREGRHFLPLPVIRPERAVLTGDTGLISAVELALKDVRLPRTRADIRAIVAAGASQLAPVLASIVEAIAPLNITDGSEARKPPTLILPIDQAEELFLTDGVGEAHAFLNILHDLAMQDTPEIIALFTIRSASYERLQTAKELEGLRQHMLSLPPMPQGAYADVIRGPARRLEGSGRSLKIEEPLIDVLLSDIEASGAKDALPLLAFTLERLYREHGGDGDLRVSEYEQLGGIKGSIEAAVERALRAADAHPEIPTDRANRLTLLRRAIIPWLAGIDPDTGLARRRVARRSEIPTESLQMVDLLVEQRLLSTDVTKDTNEVTVEPAHEALLRQWGLLQDWLAEDAGFLAILEGVKRASRDWAANGRSVAWITHATTRLEAAERLRERSDLVDTLGQTEREYLAACRKAESVASGRTRRMKGFVCMLALGIAAGTVGWWNQTLIKENYYWLGKVRTFVLNAEVEARLQPKASFWECAKSEEKYSKYCPEMVVVPAGKFMMGEEDDQHEVVIHKSFAVSKFEVTFDQWETCVTYGGCVPAADAGWGRGKRPVINVSWYDGQHYVAWLSKQTGKSYRLLSEAEWEYAARAGSHAAYSWGDDILLDGQVMANCDGCGGQWHQRTAPVGSFPANVFGLHDMLGNVLEWVQDCYHATYVDAPTDGSAFNTTNCTLGIRRGGSWLSEPIRLRTTDRGKYTIDDRDNNLGLRVGRTLTP